MERSVIEQMTMADHDESGLGGFGTNAVSGTASDGHDNWLWIQQSANFTVFLQAGRWFSSFPKRCDSNIKIYEAGKK